MSRCRATFFYVGLSSGVLAAQSLAQTRPGASGAVLCSSAVEHDEQVAALLRERVLEFLG